MKSVTGRFNHAVSLITAGNAVRPPCNSLFKPDTGQRVSIATCCHVIPRSMRCESSATNSLRVSNRGILSSGTSGDCVPSGARYPAMKLSAGLFSHLSICKTPSASATGRDPIAFIVDALRGRPSLPLAPRISVAIPDQESPLAIRCSSSATASARKSKSAVDFKSTSQR